VTDEQTLYHHLLVPIVEADLKSSSPSTCYGMRWRILLIDQLKQYLLLREQICHNNHGMCSSQTWF
jgi:hypothetical protein